MTLAEVAVSTPLNVVFLSGLSAVALVIVHVFSSRLRFLQAAPRSRWLSFGSGVSVAYVFVHILPDLSVAQETLHQSWGEGWTFLEHHVYLLSLAGLVAFYGLERAAKVSRQRNQAAGQGDVTEVEVFWLHMVSFAPYNALIGYLLLHREESGVMSLLLFAVAMGLHFLVNDYGLREHHKKPYDQIGRWILSAAVMTGWAIGSGTQIPQAAIAILFAFLAGGIVLNVLKEELPDERESRFGAFALGATGYTVLLLAL